MSFTFSVFWLPVFAVIGGALWYIFKRRGGVQLPASTLPLLLGFFFAGVGLLLLFVVAPQSRAVANNAENVPYRTGVVVDLSSGNEVMVTGVIQSSTGIPDSDSRIRRIVEDNQLVAYKAERWIIEYDDDGPRGRWTFDHQRLGEFHLESEGYRFEVLPADVTLRNTTYIDLYRQPQDWIEALDTCVEDCGRRPRYNEAKYNGQTLNEGSLAVSGYLPGETITVMGTLIDQGAIRPIHISGGTRENLLDSLKSETTSTQIGGLMGIVIGLIFVIYGYSQMPAGKNRGERLSDAEIARRSR